MITYVEGSIFLSPAPVLVNTVNLVGVMGKGIAKDFKAYFPEMFQEYERLCRRGTLEIGSLHFWRGPGKSVLNFPTKRHWRAKSRLDDIEAGLKAFAKNHRAYTTTSIAFPQLGCGYGDLNWESEVRPLMERYLGQLDLDVFIYIYSAKAAYGDEPTTDEIRDLLQSNRQLLTFEEFRSILTETIDGVAPKSADVPRGDGLSAAAIRDAWDRFVRFGYALASDLDKNVQLALESSVGSTKIIDKVRVAPAAPMKTAELFARPDASGYYLRSPLGAGQTGSQLVQVQLL